jgi:undecaprenyl-diphosphatase
LQAVDTFAFVQINELPHTRLSDRFMTRLSWAMTGGTGWLLFLLLATLVDRQRGSKAMRAVVPALWLATTTVKHPIKKWFRRRRPFVSLVEAIIVGRKPGSYSFPSGHSAAAFAGALLLAREYPGSAGGFFGLASLVAFSRIYLGAHYPNADGPVAALERPLPLLGIQQLSTPFNSIQHLRTRSVETC